MLRLMGAAYEKALAPVLRLMGAAYEKALADEDRSQRRECRS